MKNNKKILIALSGGVDSAVAAALLKKQGHQVVGVYFLFSGSTWKPSFQVKKIAKKLGIPLKIMDARKEFKKRVIDYFLSEYKNGRTPNPCVVCNKEMKFRLLFDLMRKYRADNVATGHYTRLRREYPISNIQPCLPAGRYPIKSQLQITNYKLLQGKDKQKDQSYFLYRLTQKDLAKIVFPLGDYKKSDVKKMAKKMKLPVAKNESQDICFLEGKSVNEFLGKRMKWGKGEIRDIKGNILGEHKGLPFYTIGQRKGIEIGGTGPYWVVGKNIRKNELIVTNDSKKLMTKKFCVSKVNWVNKGNSGNSGNRGEKNTFRAQVQVRYHSPKISAKITSEGSVRLTVETNEKLRAVTSGQSAVFYRNGEVLGGGVIA